MAHHPPRPPRPTLEQQHEVLYSNVVRCRDGRRHDSIKPCTLVFFLQFCYPYISPATFLLMHAYVFNSRCILEPELPSITVQQKSATGSLVGHENTQR